jgi:ABC-type dipeptide/oligopeptide/nickel transport system ATPase component
MANIRPATDRPRQAPKSRFWPRVLSAVSVSAIVLAMVAAASLWLLITDPVTAAAVMEQGDLLPVLAALAKMFGKAVLSVLSAL